MKVLKKIRIKKGLTQLSLARQAGCGQAYISLIEQGIKQPSVDLLLIIGRILKTEASSLLLEDEDLADR